METLNKEIPQLSFFCKPVYRQLPHRHFTPEQISQYIKGHYAKKATIQLRNISDKKAANKFKCAEFYFACFSGTFNKKNKDGLIKHSGLICLDFDNVPNREKLREKLLADPNITTILLFVSPSGNGLKWVVPIDLNVASHQEHFTALENYISTQYNFQIDKSGKDVARPCFLPFDPECYYNPFPEPKSFNVIKWIPAKEKIKNSVVPEIPKNYNKTESKQPTIEDIIKEIEIYQIDLTSNLRDWVKLGFAFASEFNEAGRKYFHRISRFYPGYNSDECDKQFDKCLKGERTGATIKSFFYAAKKAGIQI